MTGNASEKQSLDAVARIYRITLTPIFGFAVVMAIICWTAAWVFRDRYEFLATFVGFGCGPIVVALCAYLYVLVHKTDISSRNPG